MLPDFRSRNMTLLRQHNPRLAEELGKAGGSGGGAEKELSVEASASGCPTLVFRGRSVHSRRDPEREAERLAESVAADSAGEELPLIVLGFGLGYTVSALGAKFPERPIIVVEKYPEIIKKALEFRDLGELLSRKNLVFVLGGNGGEITGALSLFKTVPGVVSPVLPNRALTGLDGEWYARVEEQIKIWNSRTGVNRATQKRFGKRWVRNLGRNLEAVRDIPGISRLTGILKDRLRERDIPVFLAAAGPSLDGIAPFLDGIARRCIVIAVDTSLRFLVSRGIAPDFVVSVDPQFWNFRHLDRVPAPGTCLIAESAVYPACLRHPFGRIFLCGSFFPLGRFIEDRVDPKGDLGAGGSVATSAWDFARLLGARRLWIGGLDLSFPELKTHFRGAVFEENSHAASGRFSPGEAWNFRALRDGFPFRAKNRSGGSVLTDKRLSLYASWFENNFGRFPEIKNASLSGEGLDIKGLELSSPEELLALPERREEIDSLLGAAFAAAGGDFGSGRARQARAEAFEKSKKTLLEGLWEIRSLAEDAAENAGRAASRNRQGRLGEKERERALKNLDAANDAVKESAVREIAGFLFPDTDGWEEESAPGTDPLTRHLEFSGRFYRALAEAAGYTTRVLNGTAPGV